MKSSNKTILDDLRHGENHQFYLDIPRTKVYINNEECDKDPREIEIYMKRYIHPTMIHTCMHMLTQTFLADFYTQEFKKVVTDEHLHLVDNGVGIARINLPLKQIHLQKEFKKVWIDDEYRDSIVDVGCLHIHYDIVTKILTYSWIYDSCPSSAPMNTYFLKNI